MLTLLAFLFGLAGLGGAVHLVIATDSTVAAIIAAGGTVAAATLGLVNTYFNSRLMRKAEVIERKTQTIEAVVDRRSKPQSPKPNGKRKGIDDNSPNDD